MEGGYDGNSLLHEVQEKEGDKQPTPRYAQESQTGHSRCLSCLQDKSIQNRETLSICGGRRVLRGRAVAGAWPIPMSTPPGRERKSSQDNCILASPVRSWSCPRR